MQLQQLISPNISENLSDIYFPDITNHIRKKCHIIGSDDMTQVGKTLLGTKLPAPTQWDHPVGTPSGTEADDARQVPSSFKPLPVGGATQWV